MDIHFLEYLPAVFKKRLKLISVALCAVAFCVVIAVRSTKTSSTAEIKMFVRLAGDSPLSSLGGDAGLESSMSLMERDSFIASQEPLLTSYALFKETQAKIPQQKGMAVTPSLLTRAWIQTYLFIQSMLFGEDYIASREEHSNPAFHAFKQSIVFRPNSAEGTFTIGFKHLKPAAALAITKAMAESLIELNGKIKQDRALRLSVFLSEKVTEAKQALASTNEKITQFIAQNNFSDDSSILQQRYARYLKAQEAVAEAELVKVREAAVFAQETKLLEKMEQAARKNRSSSREAEIQALREQIGAFQLILLRQKDQKRSAAAESLRRRLESLRENLQQLQSASSDFLSVASFQGMIANLRTEIGKQKGVVEGAESDYQRRQRLLNVYQEEVSRFPALQAELSKLIFNQSQEIKMLSSLNEKYLASTIESDVKVSRLFMLEEPMLVTDFIYSSKMRTLISCLFVCLTGVLLLIGVLDFAKGTLFLEEQLSRRLSSTYLGVCPKVKSTPQAIALLEKDAHIRRIASRLEKSMNLQDGKSKLLALCGDSPGIGKSVTSLAIANALTKRNFAVLLVDGDFRKKERSASVTHAVQSDQVIALSDLNASLAQKPDRTGGKLLVSPLADHVVSEDEAIRYLKGDFVATLEKLKQHFDVILIDTAPTDFPEVASILELTDGIVMACPEGKTTERRIAKLEQLVGQSKGKDAQIFSVMTLATVENVHLKYRQYRMELPGDKHPESQKRAS